MSDSPLIDKVDALLNRHRSAAIPPGWVPVLTEVVDPGELQYAAPTPVATPDRSPASGPDAFAPGLATTPAIPAAIPVSQPVAAEPPGWTPADRAALTADILAELEPRLARLLEERISQQIRASLDETVALLLDQLQVHVRSIVEETLDNHLPPPG
jgi:hypothetical protein